MRLNRRQRLQVNPRRERRTRTRKPSPEARSRHLSAPATPPTVGREPAAVLVSTAPPLRLSPGGGAVGESAKTAEVSSRGLRDPRELGGKGARPWDPTCRD